MLKSTSFTFGTLLAIYLAGVDVGAVTGSVAAARIRRPVLGFFALQAGAGAYAALSLTVVVTQLGHSPWLQWFASYFGGHEGIDVRAVIIQAWNAAGAGVTTPSSK
jgi:spermidine synthase